MLSAVNDKGKFHKGGKWASSRLKIDSLQRGFSKKRKVYKWESMMFIREDEQNNVTRVENRVRGKKQNKTKPKMWDRNEKVDWGQEVGGPDSLAEVWTNSIEDGELSGFQQETLYSWRKFNLTDFCAKD